MKSKPAASKNKSATQRPAAKQASPPACSPSQAQTLAAGILEVLAGVRSPASAAELLGISLPRYYQLEAKALAGLVEALAPRPQGRQPSLENRVKQLEKELEAARREAARQGALVRLTQRSLGLAALAKPVPASPAGASRRKQRRPQVRALRAAEQLRSQAREADRESTETGGPVIAPLQPSAAASLSQESSA